MLPSTRTPEGEPLQCPVCGTYSYVEVSRPPNDSVCPSCGNLVWLSNEANLIGGRYRIRASVHDLISLCTEHASLKSIGDRLVNGLKSSLAAHGAILWAEAREGAKLHAPVLSLIAFAGECDSPSFAQRVFVAKQDLSEDLQVGDRKALLIGVPLVRSHRVHGVIQVIQRAGSPVDAQRGYLYFIRKLADALSVNALLE